MKVAKRQLETIVRKALLEQNVGTVNVEFSDGGSEESNEAHHNEEEDLSETDDEESTIKYNANPALQGDQTTLPDALQKGIIDKAKKKSKNENTMRITKKQLRKIIKESILLEQRGGRASTEGLTTLRDVIVTDRVETLGPERGRGKDRFHVSLPYKVIWPEVRMARHPVLAPPEGEAYATKKMLKKIGGDLFAYGPEAVGSTEKKALINLERKIARALARIDEKSADPKWAENPAAVEALNALKTVLEGL